MRSLRTGCCDATRLGELETSSGRAERVCVCERGGRGRRDPVCKVQSITWWWPPCGFNLPNHPPRPSLHNTLCTSSPISHDAGRLRRRLLVRGGGEELDDNPNFTRQFIISVASSTWAGRCARALRCLRLAVREQLGNMCLSNR